MSNARRRPQKTYKPQDRLAAFFDHARFNATDNQNGANWISYGAGPWEFSSYVNGSGALFVRFQSGLKNFSTVIIERHRREGRVTFKHEPYREVTFALRPRLDGEGDERLRAFLRMISGESSVDKVMEEVAYAP